MYLLHISWLKAAKARLMLDRMSLGGSFEILMQVCRMDSGTIFACMNETPVSAAGAEQHGMLAVHLVAAACHTLAKLPDMPWTKAAVHCLNAACDTIKTTK